MCYLYSIKRITKPHTTKHLTKRSILMTIFNRVNGIFCIFATETSLSFFRAFQNCHKNFSSSTRARVGGRAESPPNRFLTTGIGLNPYPFINSCQQPKIKTTVFPHDLKHAYSKYACRVLTYYN